MSTETRDREYLTKGKMIQLSLFYSIINLKCLYPLSLKDKTVQGRYGSVERGKTIDWSPLCSLLSL